MYNPAINRLLCKMHWSNLHISCVNASHPQLHSLEPTRAINTLQLIAITDLYSSRVEPLIRRWNINSLSQGINLAWLAFVSSVAWIVQLCVLCRLQDGALAHFSLFKKAKVGRKSPNGSGKSPTARKSPNSVSKPAV